jgi:hypothetical protein
MGFDFLDNRLQATGWLGFRARRARRSIGVDLLAESNSVRLMCHLLDGCRHGARIASSAFRRPSSSASRAKHCLMDAGNAFLINQVYHGVHQAVTHLSSGTFFGLTIRGRRTTTG